MYREIKICECGKEFVATQHRQKYCCDECRTAAIKEKKASYEAYNRLYKSEAEDYISGDTIFHTESQRKMKPTDVDIAETKNLLKGFGIDEAIPDLNTLADLEMWKKSQISKALM